MNTSNSARKDVAGRGRALLSVDFYVGSTDSFDAWDRIPKDINVTHAIGVWEGKSEHTAILNNLLPNVRAILEDAKFLANMSGNDCVLVTFETNEPTNNPISYVVGARKVEVTAHGSEYGVKIHAHSVYTMPRNADEPCYTFVSEPGAQLIAITVEQAGVIKSVTK